MLTYLGFTLAGSKGWAPSQRTSVYAESSSSSFAGQVTLTPLYVLLRMQEWPVHGGEWGTANCSYPEIIVTGFVMLSVRPSVRPSVRLSVCPSVIRLVVSRIQLNRWSKCHWSLKTIRREGGICPGGRAVEGKCPPTVCHSVRSLQSRLWSECSDGGNLRISK